MTELKLDIDSKFDRTLSELVESNDEVSTKAAVVQRAVATYKFFRSIPSGSKIQVVDNQGRILVSDVAVP